MTEEKRELTFAELMAHAERQRVALYAIANYDSFQGSFIAPRETPTESAMRRIAKEALNQT
jgi:hypothetical protein